MLRDRTRYLPLGQKTRGAPELGPPSDVYSISAESAALLCPRYCRHPVATDLGNGRDGGRSVTRRSRSWFSLAPNVGIAQAGKSCPDVPETRSSQNAPQRPCFRNIRDVALPDRLFAHPSLRHPIFRPFRHFSAGRFPRLPTCSALHDRKRHEDQSAS
jgi:hypothetical protein